MDEVDKWKYVILLEALPRWLDEQQLATAAATTNQIHLNSACATSSIYQIAIRTLWRYSCGIQTAKNHQETSAVSVTFVREEQSHTTGDWPPKQAEKTSTRKSERNQHASYSCCISWQGQSHGGPRLCKQNHASPAARRSREQKISQTAKVPGKLR